MDPRSMKTLNDKGARHELLPNRHALNQLTGNPEKRALGNYSKATPSIDDSGPNIFGKDIAK